MGENFFKLILTNGSFAKYKSNFVEQNKQWLRKQVL